METVQHASNIQRVSDIFSLTQALYDMPLCIDMIEFCGGKGRASRVCVRRGLSTGGNSDIVTGVDLNDPEQQSKLHEYIDRARPLVAVLQPTCTACGPQGRQNMSIMMDGNDRFSETSRIVLIAARLRSSRCRTADFTYESSRTQRQWMISTLGRWSLDTQAISEKLLTNAWLACAARTADLYVSAQLLIPTQRPLFLTSKV